MLPSLCKISPEGHHCSGKFFVLFREALTVVQRKAEDVGDLVGVKNSGPEINLIFFCKKLFQSLELFFLNQLYLVKRC